MLNSELRAQVRQRLGLPNIQEGQEFKTYLIDTVHNTFLNPYLFASEHLINDDPILAVVANVEYKQPSFYEQTAILSQVLKVSFAQDTLNKCFYPGDHIELDNAPYIVKKVTSDYGVISLYLSRYEL